MEIKPEALANSQKVGKLWAGEDKDFSPYMPCNGEEGDWFERGWCRRCKHDIPIDDNCEILMEAYIGDQPKEWFYHQNNPLCTKFEAR